MAPSNQSKPPDEPTCDQIDPPAREHISVRNEGAMAKLSRIQVLLLVVALQLLRPDISYADEVLDWNAIAVRAMQTAPVVAGYAQPRFLAIMHAAIFDAVNGIERRYAPIHVLSEAPRGASRRAAAVQAAYTALTLMRPAAQHAGLAADRDASLARIADEEGIANSESIARGLAWGEQVANAIWNWRSGDVLEEPGVIGATGPGEWRPTPRPNPAGGELAGLPMTGALLGQVEPFALKDPVTGNSKVLDFRPPGPPPLNSQQYADDVLEVQRVGSIAATPVQRTAAQTLSARFWGGAASSVWNRAAAAAARGRNTTLSQNARLFALLNISAADALIVAWDAKRFFNFWRPVTAIRLADTDGNSLTVADPTWTPLLVTPAYPDYYSGHQSISGASCGVLKAFFGNGTPVEAFSEAVPGLVLTWPNFDAAADDALMARIWAGIHFRTAMVDTRVNAESIAAFVMEHAAQPLRGERVGHLSK